MLDDLFGDKDEDEILDFLSDWLDTPAKSLGDEPDPLEDYGETYAGKTPDGDLSWALFRAAEDDREGPEEYVASTATPDRMGDSVDQRTMQLARFRQNPVILYEHRAPVVGIATKVGRKKNPERMGGLELRMSIQWDETTVNPTGMLVAHQHKNRIRNALSISFIPHEAISRTELPVDDPLFVDGREVSRWRAGYLYKSCELLETSSVGVPANSEALRLAMDAIRGDTEADRKRFLDASFQKEFADLFVNLCKSDRKVRRIITACAMADADFNPSRRARDEPPPKKTNAPAADFLDELLSK